MRNRHCSAALVDALNAVNVELHNTPLVPFAREVIEVNGLRVSIFVRPAEIINWMVLVIFDVTNDDLQESELGQLTVRLENTIESHGSSDAPIQPDGLVLFRVVILEQDTRLSILL